MSYTSPASANNVVVSGHRRAAWRAAVAGLGCLALLAAACSPAAPPASAPPTAASAAGTAAPPAATGGKASYKIGVVAPLSGDQAFIGKVQLDALTVLINSVNKDGGIAGHMIELRAQDAADAPASVTAVRTLDSEGVLAIYGPPVSAALQAVVPIATQAKISIMTPGNSDSTLVPPQQYIFQTDAGATSDAEPMVVFASSLMAGKGSKIAASFSDTPAGAQWAKNVAEKWAPKHDMSVMQSTALPLTTTDLTPQAQAIAASNADIILSEVSDAGATTLVPALRQRGFTGPIVAYSSTGSEPTLQKLNDPKLYVEKDIAYPGSDETGKPGVARFNSLLTAAGQMDEAKGNPLYGRGYVGGLALVGALQQCADNCTRDSLNAALNNLTVDTQGLTPAPIKLSKDNHQAVGSAVFWHFADGKLTLADDKVYPSSIYDKP